MEIFSADSYVLQVSISAIDEGRKESDYLVVDWGVFSYVTIHPLGFCLCE
jgi:hypothetical protein